MKGRISRCSLKLKVQSRKNKRRYALYVRERSLDSRIRENDKRAIHVMPVQTGIQKAPWIPGQAGNDKMDCFVRI